MNDMTSNDQTTRSRTDADCILNRREGSDTTDLGASVADLLARKGAEKADWTAAQAAEKADATAAADADSTDAPSVPQEAPAKDYTPAEPEDPVADEKAHKAQRARLGRALDETMAVDADSFDTPGVVRVWSDSGSAYVVNVGTGECSCPDFEYRGAYCKHLFRAVLEGAQDPHTAGCTACHRDTFCMMHA